MAQPGAGPRQNVHGDRSGCFAQLLAFHACCSLVSCESYDLRPSRRFEPQGLKREVALHRKRQQTPQHELQANSEALFLDTLTLIPNCDNTNPEPQAVRSLR